MDELREVVTSRLDGYTYELVSRMTPKGVQVEVKRVGTEDGAKYYVDGDSPAHGIAFGRFFVQASELQQA